MDKDQVKLLRKVFAATVKDINEADRTMRVVISTVNPDRSKDVVFPAGMDISKFMANPVVSEFHDYHAPAIANGMDIAKFDDRVEATVKFFEPGTYERSDLFWKLYSTQKMRAWSIGFIPKTYTINEMGGYDFTETELLEFAAVLVPDNPEALSYAKELGMDTDKALAKVKEVSEATDATEGALEKPADPAPQDPPAADPAPATDPKEDDPKPEDEAAKAAAAAAAVTKDVDEVVSLADVAGYLQFLIRAFGRNEVDEKVIAKLIDALKVIMEAIKSEAEVGKKTFNMPKAEKTADIDPEYQPKDPEPPADPEPPKDEAKQLIVAMAKELKPAVSSINKFLHAMRELNQSATE